jgi:hypothetical protein
VRKLIVAASSLALFGAGWCFGQAQHGNDGNGWHTLSLVARAFYVNGFAEGYRSGMIHSAAVATAERAREKVLSMTPDEKKVYEENLRWGRRMIPIVLAKPPTTVGDLEGALDTFYGDYRNTPVCWDQAILLAVSSFGGNAATDQELDTARKKGAEQGCK